MSYPPYTPAEARSRETFLALMWALSYPGRIHSLPQTPNSLELIGETLLDLETSFYTPDAALHMALSQSGARALPVEVAAYQFYPVLSDAILAEIARASVGTLLYPDTSATLIFPAVFDSGISMKWRGPGIDGVRSVQLEGIPPEFWALRASACRFPLGWDIYFADGPQLIGLPRSIQVTIE